MLSPTLPKKSEISLRPLNGPKSPSMMPSSVKSAAYSSPDEKASTTFAYTCLCRRIASVSSRSWTRCSSVAIHSLLSCPFG